MNITSSDSTTLRKFGNSATAQQQSRVSVLVPRQLTLQQQLPPQTYLRPDAGHLGDGTGGGSGGTVEPPFGVYAEAYALQTRHQGVWGR